MKFLSWLKQSLRLADSAPPARRAPRHRLNVLTLEDRITPAITVTLDYSLDANGFFSDPSRRAVLQTAVNAIASQLNNDLLPINPSGGDTWNPQIFNPATGTSQVLAPIDVAENEIRIYVGGRHLAGSEAGEGGTGGAFRVSGDNAWIDRVQNRGQGDTQDSGATGFGPWGGSIAFDTATNWYFGADPNGIASNQLSFYSVVQHELGHVLGFGTSPSYANKVSGARFTGSTAVSLYGSSVPLDSSVDTDHWNESVTYAGKQPSMTPVLAQGTFTIFTTLDYAALADIGWKVSNLNFAPGSGAGTGGSTNTPITLPTAPTPTYGGVVGKTIFAVGTDAGNEPHVEVFNLDGTLRFSFYAYAQNMLSGVRVATADINGDGYEDIITAPGPGGGPNVKVFDGRTGQELESFYAYATDFVKGVYVAAGDVNGDGFADIITGAGAGGGPHVKVFDGKTGQEIQSFYAYEPEYAGGVVVAAGDITHSGHADIITGTGPGYPAHVRVLDGITLMELRSFYAYTPSFTGGITVSAGDINGDGYADIITSAGAGGGPHVQAFDGRTGQVIASFYAGPSNLANGIVVTAKDVNGDGKADLVTGLGSGIAPLVTVYSGTDQSVVEQFYAYETNYTGGFSIG